MTRMHDPAHPGEIIREALQAERWTVTEAAVRLGVTRQTLSRVVNGRASVSPRLALALDHPSLPLARLRTLGWPCFQISGAAARFPIHRLYLAKEAYLSYEHPLTDPQFMHL